MGCVSPPKYPRLRRTCRRPTAGADRETGPPSAAEQACSGPGISAGCNSMSSDHPFVSPTMCRLHPFTICAGNVHSGAPRFRGCHALPIGRAGTGTAVLPRLRSRRDPHWVMQVRLWGLPAPLAEPRVDRGPDRQIRLQTAPSTPCTQHVPEAVPKWAGGSPL